MYLPLAGAFAITACGSSCSLTPVPIVTPTGTESAKVFCFTFGCVSIALILLLTRAGKMALRSSRQPVCYQTGRRTAGSVVIQTADGPVIKEFHQEYLTKPNSKAAVPIQTKGGPAVAGTTPPVSTPQLGGSDGTRLWGRA